MAIVFIRWNALSRLILAFAVLFFYNEILIYYIAMLKCQWPLLSSGGDVGRDGQSGFLKVMVLADVHLLGSREGHWFDKIRREWQMERSFQSSMLVHEPDVVFILGDVFDEGKWCSDSEFLHYVTRFRRMFATPQKTSLFVLVGNHDIGFHYMVDDHKRHRFEKHLGTSLIQKVNLKDNLFVLINSMALEGDGCRMCSEAQIQLEAIYRSIKCCGDEEWDCDSKDATIPCTPPILLSHFPLYRLNDSGCEGLDSAPDEEKYIPFKQKSDCLGRDVSNQLLSKLRPRLVLSGHTHHFCITNHTLDPIVDLNMYNNKKKNKTKKRNNKDNNNIVAEWTLPSFSWRYKNNPSFLMISLSHSEHSTNKCFLPSETTVITTYVIVSAIIISLYLLLPFILGYKTCT